MAISNLPAAPARSDTPTNFITKADAFIAALPTFVTEANSTAAAMNLNSTTDTSATSVLIGLGAKTFTVTAGKSFQPSMYLVIGDTAAPTTNSMFGQVSSYTGTSLVMNILSTRGSGTLAAWTISQSAAGGANLDTNLFTGTQTLGAGAALNESLSTLASSATPNIWANQSNLINYTGIVTATGFAAAPQAGVRRTLILADASSFTAGANMLIDGVMSFTGAAGDEIEVEAVSTTQFRLRPKKYDGTAIINTSKLQSLTATQATGALTFALNPTSLDFRSTSLASGVPATVTLAVQSTLVLASGGTLGAVTTIQARLVLIALNNAGVIEPAIINLAGGNSLDETGLISTTAISAASTANNVFYSTVARTGVAYRVVGFVDAVNTAGAWANPVLVQGTGGQALAALSSLGYGQTWQDLTASRALATVYYNTTGKPIQIGVTATGSVVSSTYKATVGGIDLLTTFAGAAQNQAAHWFIVPSGASYSLSQVVATITIQRWLELR